MAVKRFQRIGVIQPEIVVEDSSSPTNLGKVETRLQVAGSISKEISIESSSKRSDATIASAALFDNAPSFQPQAVTDPPSRQDGVTKLDTQPSISQPWGGRSVTYSPTAKTVIATARRDSATVIERKGGIATFPQRIDKDIITTVVRGYPGIANHRYGGTSVSPLYWLDTEPEYREISARSRWTAEGVPNGRFTATQTDTPRFTLSVDGGLEWPLFQA